MPPVSGFSYPRSAVIRLIGAAAMVVGVAIVGFSPTAFDASVLTLPSGYPVHGYDVVGMTLVLFGLIAFWRRPPRVH